ncbi:TlpA family protein disulfide reductase [Streptomyces sp. LBUM 1478]|uniref:Putative redoxin n=1 Tax=Streptomyces scabiei (strain 87.22) TaxID=680198 RepID=C9Z8P4_STRSW|nr:MULTISPECIES: TlpA disulfide reductase family protein [Streptomyces]MBP5862492.1 TlpA family protein disulfide reductase [Streptomyces sp. LBUM 1484]MBP5868558.1 TlpA family protein disulfide reductase [Streptomyces sp. LBUM 1485]MBP5907112.1 TlpA family protein disulfide reductase [Streptomyces sp. LBUM 1478]MBP5930046.1 TlpA family protein disulfide reductase [Streptomyces sp. LBUM 1479]MBP5877092.1 TlpA family protein disulfide reductase [Streptomyces sp. LBUM 1477]
MAIRKTARPAALCALVVVLLSGCSTSEPLVLDTDSAQSGMPQPFERVPVAERTDAPVFSGRTVDGKQVRLSDYRGDVVVVNAWATSCGPCRAEAPALERTYRTFGDRGVRVLGISTDVERRNARAFQREFGLTYPSLHDPKGRQFLELPRGMVNPQFLPFTLFVDRAGRIAGAVQARLDEKELAAILTPLLNEGKEAGR